MPRMTLLLLSMIFGLNLSAQDFSNLDVSPLDAAYYPARAAFRAFAKTDSAAQALEPKIRVLYSRPFKKDRTIFGELVPYNEPSRLGANETTEITFYAPVMIGDKLVPAGRYTMGAIPTETEWEVFFSVDVDGWGVYAYNPDHNVATITVPTANVTDVIENFSITLYEAGPQTVHLKMGWDQTVVEVPIKLMGE
jgi:hypothetical protein